MPERVSLNEKQEALLRWIAEGCPDGVMPDDSHRISAAALRNRGLATTSGRGPSWKAKLTPAGRAYLDELDGSPWPHGGLELEAEPAGATEPGTRRERVHPVVRDFRERIERHEVSRDQLPRATSLVAAIVREAERRGWNVESARESENEFGLRDWSSAKDGHLSVDVGDQRFWIRVQEEGVRTRGALEDGDEISYDLDANGRLKLEVRWGEWFTRQQTRWADREDSRLEQRLDEVFAEIDGRVGEAHRVAGEKQARAEQAAAQERSVAQAREREWSEHMARARELYFDAARADALRAQAAAWEEAQRLRAYCDALSAEHGSDPGVQEWIGWARAYAERHDPLGRPQRMPDVEEPAPAALQAYLPEGWSARGP